MIDFFLEREKRIYNIKVEGAGSLNLFKDVINKSEKLKNKETVKRTLAFIESLDIFHGNLSKEAYLSHPLRIATMLMNFLENFNEEQINLALLHNIYEVSNVNKKIISNKFGIKMAEDIEILTVRRELQWNIEYKKAYYKKIYNACLNVGQIKSLDKFDNIFTICLNPDDEIRIKYIDEIKQFVLPLVKKTLPILYKDFSNCCSEAENLGYSPIR